MENYEVEIKIWSAIGHTPVTQRGGSFCDVLLDARTTATNPVDAATQVRKLLSETPYARTAFFNMPQFPNQNTRSQWINR